MYEAPTNGSVRNMTLPAPDITLRFEEGRLTDGVHVYWRSWDGLRIRWARKRWPDDGVGARSHGAAQSLVEAIEDAEQARRVRVSCDST